jgi:hypothetical protein
MASTFDEIEAQRVTQKQWATGAEHLVPYAQVVGLLGEIFKGAWSSATAYEAGWAVNEAGSFYIANIANTNKQPSANPTEWRLAAEAGADAFVYVRYADDASGTGFSTSPSGKTYVAIKATDTEIASPVVGDFTGLWVKFVGDAGATGTTGAAGATGAAGDSSFTYIAYASDTSGTGFSLTPGSGLNYVAFKTTDTEIVSPVAGDFAGLWRQYAVAALAATAPLTYDSSTGVMSLNAASVNTASYVVQRDANGDFAARKIVLGTATATDHVTFGSAATMGYTGGNVVFNVPVKPTKLIVGTLHELRPGSGKTEIYSIADLANAMEITGTTVKVVTTLQVAALSGVLKASGGTVSGAATSDDVTEGASNLYFTTGRATDAAEELLDTLLGVANGIAELGSDGKLATSQIPSALVGATVYQGGWNANSNSPALATGTGTKGFYYIVTTAGTTALDGIASWAIGDWAIFNGTIWEKVDNTDAVISVNGHLGTVVLVTDDIAEDGSPTNLWFTTARVLATALTGFSATTGAITASDTVLSGFNKTQGRLAALESWVVSDFAPGVRATTLTGFSATVGAITASDTVLSGFNKAQGRLAAIEAWTTANLTEGANLYYTDARVKTVAAAGLNAVIVSPALSTSGSPNLFTVTGPAHTTLTASAEAADVYLNLARMVQFATGAVAVQRAVRIEAPQYAFVAASTITDASSVAISGAPIAWSNASITNSVALRIAGGSVAAGTTNGYGLHVTAPVDATNNFAALLNGSVVIGGTPSMGGGVGVVFLANAGVNPSSNPTGGGVIYVDAGALKYRGSSGTVTTLGPA